MYLVSYHVCGHFLTVAVMVVIVVVAVSYGKV